MNSSVEAPDEVLMARVQAGDEQALALLVHRYEHALFNYARKMLGRAEDAEEIFQETFVRVYQHRARYRPERPFRPWLYRITTNLCRDRLRYRKRRPEVNESALQPEDEQRDDFTARQPDETMGPDEQAVARERLRWRRWEALTVAKVRRQSTGDGWPVLTRRDALAVAMLIDAMVSDACMWSMRSSMET